MLKNCIFNIIVEILVNIKLFCFIAIIQKSIHIYHILLINCYYLVNWKKTFPTTIIYYLKMILMLSLNNNMRYIYEITNIVYWSNTINKKNSKMSKNRYILKISKREDWFFEITFISNMYDNYSCNFNT